MKKYFKLASQVVITLALVFMLSPQLIYAAGFSSKTVSGVNAIRSMKAVTATYADGEFTGTSGAIDDCAFFYIRPYTLDSTLDLIVQAGANSYTATHTYKIKAASTNVANEFGPFYMDETDTTINYYLAVTTNAAPAYSATIYVRTYRPAKHNY